MRILLKPDRARDERCELAVLLCAEGGPSRGFGHISRILALSEDLRAPSGLLLLAPAAEDAALKVLECIHGEVVYDSSENAVDAVVAGVRDRAPRVLVLDGVCFDDRFFAELERARLPVTIVLLESRTVTGAGIDIRIRPSMKEPSSHEGPSFDGNDYWVLGMKYDELLRQVRPVPERCPRVLLTMGGTDHLRLTERLIEPIIMTLPGSRVDVVVGPLFGGDTARLREVAEAFTEVHLHEDPGNLANLMHAADVAVTAGGFTTYELAALGVPMLIISTTADEDRNANILAAAGCARVAALYADTESNELAERVARDLLQLASDVEGRKTMSFAGRRVIDGLGRKRVQRIILDALDARGDNRQRHGCKARETADA
jgi:UDP-2,4-diacetamido-2,4,6-trideoxy-beta-L-altropyranose hydrolase